MAHDLSRRCRSLAGSSRGRNGKIAPIPDAFAATEQVRAFAVAVVLLFFAGFELSAVLQAILFQFMGRRS